MQSRKKYLHHPFHEKIVVEHVPEIDVTTPMYGIAPFKKLKDQLNDAKSQLDIYYNNPRDNRLWARAQGSLDLYKSLRYTLERDFGAQHVSNAWMKYYEIFGEFLNPEFRDTAPKVFFNAELPGSSVCAFNHYMNGRDYTWRASSLLTPSADNSALDDAYGLLRGNPDNWLVSVDGQSVDGQSVDGRLSVDSTYINNGDSTSVDNLLDLEARIGPNSAFGGVDLYSHDAGLDASSDFNQQESMNAKLHLGCALAGFMTLKPGGTFIAKQYTCFETLTWNLMIVYASLFQELHLYKPLTSRPFNSEIYLVGIGFKGFTGPLRDRLLGRLRDFSMAPVLPADSVKIMYADCLGTITSFAQHVFTTQAEYIQESIDLFKRYKHDLRTLEKYCASAKKSAQTLWLQKNKVPRITKQRWLQTSQLSTKN